MKRAALNLRVSTVENGQARPKHCSIGDSSRGTLPYLEDGRLLEDPVSDFVSFYMPSKRALMARPKAGS